MSATGGILLAMRGRGRRSRRGGKSFRDLSLTTTTAVKSVKGRDQLRLSPFLYVASLMGGQDEAVEKPPSLFASIYRFDIRLRGMTIVGEAAIHKQRATGFILSRQAAKR